MRFTNAQERAETNTTTGGADRHSPIGTPLPLLAVLLALLLSSASVSGEPGVLEPFHKYGGMGLCLTICKRLTELMGGESEVKSESGKGNTLSF